jgi:hypothetical protein
MVPSGPAKAHQTALFQHAQFAHELQRWYAARLPLDEHAGLADMLPFRWMRGLVASQGAFGDAPGLVMTQRKNAFGERFVMRRRGKLP